MASEEVTPEQLAEAIEWAGYVCDPESEPPDSPTHIDAGELQLIIARALLHQTARVAELEKTVERTTDLEKSANANFSHAILALAQMFAGESFEGMSRLSQEDQVQYERKAFQLVARYAARAALAQQKEESRG